MRNYFKLLIVFILGKLKPKKKGVELSESVNAQNLIDEILSYQKGENRQYYDSLDIFHDKLSYLKGTHKTDNQNKPNPTE